MAPELVNPQDRHIQLKKVIDQRRPDFDKLLSAFNTAQKDRYFQVLLTALRDPYIREATPVSIIDAMLKSAQWGLPVDGTHAALVAYGPPGNKTCQFIPMYRGMMEVCRRSGKIAEVYADVVLNGEHVEVQMGTNPVLIHRPDILRDRTAVDDVVAAYACAKWTSSGTQFVILSRAELEHCRQVSKAKRPEAPWQMWPVEMFKKTAVRRLMKLLPIGEGWSELLDEDEKADIDINGLRVDVPSPRRASSRGPQTLDDLGHGGLPIAAGGDDTVSLSAQETPQEPASEAKNEAAEAVIKARRGAKQAEFPEPTGSDWPRR